MSECVDKFYIRKTYYGGEIGLTFDIVLVLFLMIGARAPLKIMFYKISYHLKHILYFRVVDRYEKFV